MRLRRLVPALLFLWCSMWAADPFAGKWRLNIERSDFVHGPKAKRGSATYTPKSGGYQYECETVFDKGNYGRLVMPVTFDDTVYPGRLGGRGIVFSSKRIDASSYRTLIADSYGAKATQMFQYVVSSDGKTLTFTWIKGGKDKAGIYWVLVYDKE
jgi:hypothetical protein